MQTLWVVTTDFELRLYALEADVEKLIHALGFRVCCLNPAPPEKTIAVSIGINNQAFALGACPLSWFVRDVVIALRCQHPSIADVISVDDAGVWEVRTVADDMLLPMTTALEVVPSVAWILKHRNPQTSQLGSKVILRGFPFAWIDDDIWYFLRRNNAADSVRELKRVMRKKPKSDRVTTPRFLGIVEVFLASDSNIREFTSSVHHAIAGERYIEILNPVSRHKRDNPASLVTDATSTFTIRLDYLSVGDTGGT